MAADDLWKTQSFRQYIIARIDQTFGIQVSEMPTSNSIEMENHFFQNAKSKEEYLGSVARLILRVIEMRKGNTGTNNQGMLDTIGALQTLTLQETGNNEMMGMGGPGLNHQGIISQPPANTATFDEPQRETENLSNSKDECYDEGDIINSNLLANTSGLNLNYKQKSQCTKNLSNPDEECCDEDDINDDVNPILPTNNTPGMENFQQFVVRKLINLELKVDNMSQKLKSINTNQKLILEKLSLNAAVEMEQTEIDIFEDLPLSDENSLQLMETKLQDNLSYRNQMIKQLVRRTCDNMKTSCLRLIKSILSNELAEKYSWYGTKKKQNFSKLNISKIIMSVIRKLDDNNVTDEQIAAPIKIWLAHAKDRMERLRNNIQTE